MSTQPSPDETLGPARTMVDDKLRSILGEVLMLDAERTAALDNDSGLFGHMPELDSMAVATLFTAIEDGFDIVIEDEDVDAEMLETYGALLAFTEAKTVTA